MKKIYYAALQSSGNYSENEDRPYGEYFWQESYEAEYGEEWDGDVLAYLENAAEDVDALYDMINREWHGAINNEPEGAIILINEDCIPAEIWWSAEDDDSCLD